MGIWASAAAGLRRDTQLNAVRIELSLMKAEERDLCGRSVASL